MMAALLISCAAQEPRLGSSPPRPAVAGAVAKEAGLGLFVVASIAAVPAAIATVPFASRAPSRASEVALPSRNEDVTLDEAYWIALGYHTNSDRVDQQTGQVIATGAPRVRALWEARRDVLRLIRRHQVDEDGYLICSEPAAVDDGESLLLSIVHRNGPLPAPKAAAEELEPHAATDAVLDWALVPRRLLESDRAYAELLAAAANDVLHERRGADYWQVSALWREGRHDEVRARSESRARRASAAAYEEAPAK